MLSRNTANYLVRISFPLVITVTTLMVNSFHYRLFLLLRYQRERILAGEWWRLFSGHIVHVSGPHLWMNLSGVIVLWLLYKDVLLWWMWWFLMLAGMLGVSFGLLLFSPEVDWYAGLSGVLHSVYVGGAIIFFRYSWKKGSLLLGILMTKILWEQLYGVMPGSADITGANVIVDSHLYGALSGLTVIMAIIIARSLSQHPAID